MKPLIRIGAGSAWWGDRIEPARLNAERGDLDYLCFETMAEATISAAQVRARRDPTFPGYDTYLDDRMRAVLPACLKRGTKIITNQGWINPRGAAERIVHWLRECGAPKGIKVAAVDGSLITDRVLALTDTILENGKPTATLRENLVSAEVYLGAEPIAEALRAGAQIVVSGRVADPSIFMAPMMYEFGWDPLDHAKLGAFAGKDNLVLALFEERFDRSHFSVMGYRRNGCCTVRRNVPNGSQHLSRYSNRVPAFFIEEHFVKGIVARWNDDSVALGTAPEVCMARMNSRHRSESHGACGRR